MGDEITSVDSKTNDFEPPDLVFRFRAPRPDEAWEDHAAAAMDVFGDHVALYWKERKANYRSARGKSAF